MKASDIPSAAAITVLYLFGVSAVAGFATFGLHPELLAAAGPSAARFYSRAFGFFGQGQVALAGAVLFLILLRAVGFRWLPAFATAYAISLASELAGTTWGIPFGEYGYTALLGPRWLERVPALIPLSWFTMALPAYALAHHRWPDQPGRAVLLGSFILLIWDVSLDPAMSYATSYWWWGHEGAFYGMPALNLLGWYVTGLAIMAAFAGLRVERWVHRVSLRTHALYYGANLLVPLGMCVAAGLWGAVLISVALLAAVGHQLAASAPARAAAPRLVPVVG